MKILLIRLDHLGDLVLTTPLIRALVRAGHAVDVVVPRWLRPVLEGNPHLRGSFSLEDIAPQFPAPWEPLRDWMRSRDYDCVLLPNARPRALLWCSLGSGALRRIAMQAGIWGRLTGHRCLRVKKAMLKGRHFSDIQLDLARAIRVKPDGLKPDYFCRKEEITAAQQRFAAAFPSSAGTPIIGLHPGCAGNTCNLPAAVYGELAGLILERTDWRIVLTGSTEERALTSSWPREILGSPRVLDTMGALDLRALAATISQLSRYVSVGTGPMHLAVALGVRTVSPFCALPPLDFAVWGNACGPAACLEPKAENCRRWRSESNRMCDFRGEITAENLWSALADPDPRAGT